jgi:AmmeMemoRadiSam system protein A
LVAEERIAAKESAMTEFHPLVSLARKAIERRIREGVRIEPPDELLLEFQRQAGAFVTIHRHGKLRGCIGTIQPTCENVAAEVVQNAISAAERDPRFPPVTSDELAELDVKVDVLGEPELVTSLDQLDPKRYGLIVQSENQPHRRGLLLPDLEGIDTVEKQVYWTRHHKAGITDPDEPVRMYRFEVTRYT